MVYPLISRQLLADLRLVHGMFNFSMMLAFLYQGWVGLAIRRARLAHAPLPFPLIKRHRKTGPIIAILAGLGFLSGITLVLLDTGNILEHLSHLITGVLLIVLIISTYKVSRDIKGNDSPYRTPHAVLGIAILSLYLVEVFLGLGVLL